MWSYGAFVVDHLPGVATLADQAAPWKMANVLRCDKRVSVVVEEVHEKRARKS